MNSVVCIYKYCLCPFDLGDGVSGHPPGPVDTCPQRREGSSITDLPPSIM